MTRRRRSCLPRRDSRRRLPLAQWDSGRGYAGDCKTCSLYNAGGGLRANHAVTLKAILEAAGAQGMAVDLVLFSQESWRANVRLEGGRADRAVDDEPARNGTPNFGGPRDVTFPIDHILQIHQMWTPGAYIVYHHDMFQTGYETPAVPPHGVPDPEFNPYHRAVLEFIARRGRYQ